MTNFPNTPDKLRYNTPQDLGDGFLEGGKSGEEVKDNQEIGAISTGTVQEINGVLNPNFGSSPFPRVIEETNGEVGKILHGNFRPEATRVFNLIEAGRVTPFLQPIIPVSGNKEASPKYECLMRLNDEEDNLIPPAAFFKHFDETNEGKEVYLDATKQMIEKSVAIAAEHGISITLNFSEVEIKSLDIHNFLLDVCSRYKVDHSSVTIELLENIPVDQIDDNFRKMANKLKDSGFILAVDDFNPNDWLSERLMKVTMFSEFSDIIKMDLAYVKILIRALTRKTNNEIIEHALDRMKRGELLKNDTLFSSIMKDPNCPEEDVDAFELIMSLYNLLTIYGRQGKELVFEGLETQKDIDLLKSFLENYNVTCYFQGYGISRPQSPEDLFENNSNIQNN